MKEEGEKNGRDKRKKGKKKDTPYEWYFLGIVWALYGFLFLVDRTKTLTALDTSGQVLINIAPIIIVVFLLMGLMNYFMKPKAIAKHVGEESGAKGWGLAIAAGILSHGPIYVWYPLLKDLNDKGMRLGLVAAFLYNRSIKLPLLPVMIFYFGWGFVVILMVGMILASFLEGTVIDIMDKKDHTGV